jgi:alkylation response protein AidB-like acyl-CoA dehydrogenase
LNIDSAKGKAMTSMTALRAVTPLLTPPPAAQLIARAQAMIPLLRERAGDVDRHSKLAPDVMREIRNAGFFRILQPQRFGGYGLQPSVLWDVTRHLSRGCGSTGFVVSLLGLHSWIAGMFDARAQQEVFAKGSDAVIPNLSIGVRRRNEVEAVDGGFVVTGQWSYASGIDYADWVIAAIRVPMQGNEHEERIALIPADAFEIDYGSWNVVGARGTGSKTVSLAKVFVPAYRTLLWASLQSSDFPGAKVNDGPLYKMSAGSLLPLSSAAPVVGVACAIVDHFIDEMKKRGGAKRAAEQQWVQIALGRHASQIHMAHALLIADADEVYDAAVAGAELSLEVQARHRADAAIISRSALAAADELIAALGGSLLPAGHPVERSLRDLHAIASHFRVQPEAPCEQYGRVLLGQEL